MAENQTARFHAVPLAPTSIEDTGLPSNYLADLTLKAIHHSGRLTAGEAAAYLKLPYANVLELLLKGLVSDKLCEVTHGTGYMATTWTYEATERGRTRVADIMSRDSYVGPAPVSLQYYNDIVRCQTVQFGRVTPDVVERAFQDLVIDDLFRLQIGPAVSSGKSMFLYGPPGNGKTSIAERIVNMLAGKVWIPYAVLTGFEVMTIFDAAVHKYREDAFESLCQRHGSLDERLCVCDRPMVMTGGELTFQSLDLMYDERNRFYTSPLQVKANGGLLLIDDFGRQRVSPRDLLNRWIVPLEKRMDFLNLRSGKQIAVPFDVLVVFSTNLEPRDLVDEAFLRRIRYKVAVGDPTEKQYRDIFRACCQAKGVPFRQEMVDWLLERYKRDGFPLRSCHPRDLLEQILDRARYMGKPVALDEESVEYACKTYFVKL